MRHMIEVLIACSEDIEPQRANSDASPGGAKRRHALISGTC